MYTQISQIVEIVQKKRKQGARIGFTNGCFDVLHYGHLATLGYAKNHCDYLIVAVDDDKNVRRLKGPGRPVNPDWARAVLLESLKFVDASIVFSEQTLGQLLDEIRPDVMVKGEEYRGKEIIRSPYVGRLLFAPMIPGFSTTKTIEKTVFGDRVIIPKVWGREEIFINSDKYCGKYLHFNKGAQASLHYHDYKDETFMILSGKFTLQLGLGPLTHTLKINDSIRIYPKAPHRLKCLETGVILEISTADDPLDCVRLEPSKAAPDIQQSLDL